MKKSAIVVNAISLVAWILPIIGIPVAIVGIILSRDDLQESQNAAMIMGVIGLVLSFGNWLLGAIMEMS